MRKILQLFCVFLITQNVHLQAQAPPLCLSAKFLLPISNPDYTRIDTTLQLSIGEKWFKFSSESDSISIKLISFLTGMGSRANKIELYKGPNCSALTYLSNDSLTSTSDSILNIHVDSLNISDTLYLRVKNINNTFCPSCPNTNMKFRVHAEFLHSQALVCATCTSMTGCNLVCNGNFEQYFSIYSGGSNITDACGWSNLNNATCDYYSTTLPAGFNISIPCNYRGYEFPNPLVSPPGLGGNGYAGFRGTPSATDATFPNGYAEYMKTKLLYPLVAGATYTVSFWLSLGEISRLSGSNIGIYFFDNPSNLPPGTTTTNTPLGFSPTLSFNTTGLTKNGWTQFSTNFIPPTGSNFQYMAIGAFTTSYSQISCSNNSNGCSDYECDWQAYYYIDDISVIGKINIGTQYFASCQGRSQCMTTSLTPPIAWAGLSTPITGQTMCSHNPGTYTATSTNNPNGCTMTETFVVMDIMNPNEIITITPNPAYVCPPNQTIALTASGLSSGVYNWYNNAAFFGTAVNALPPLLATSPNYTYTIGQNTYNHVAVTGVAANGCQTMAIVPVSVATQPNAIITANGLSMCSTTNLIGTYTAAPQATGAIYTWSVTIGATNVPFTTAPGGQSITVNWSAYTGSTANAQICLTVNQGCTASSCITVKPCCVPSAEYIIVAGSLDPANPTVLSNATLPALGGTNTNASFAMNGYFSIAPSSTINWNNMRFAMAPGTKITVPSAAILKLTDCHFFACSQMWDGIYVQAGGSVQFSKYNLMEDAVNAVVIETNATATPILINKVYFNKCHIGVDFRASAVINNSIIIGCVFTSRNFGINTAAATMPSTYMGNSGVPLNYPSSNYTFYPGANVVLPYLPSRAHIGVNIANNLQVSVGYTSTTAANLNVFDNLTYGIHGLSSSVYSLNNKFINIQKYCSGGLCFEPFTVSTCPPGTAICTGTSGLIASVATPKFTKVGVAATGVSYPNYFEQSQYGIYNSNNRNLDVRDNQFTVINNTGIYNAFSSNYFSSGLGTFPSNTLTIQGNKMDRAQNGVFLNDNRNAVMAINTNEFNWTNWSTTSTQQSLTGITVNNAVAHTVGSLTITRNNIANLQKGITLTMQGYTGTGTSNRVYLNQNQIRFNQLQTSTVAAQHYGVGVFASKRVTIDGDLGLGEIIRVSGTPGSLNPLPNQTTLLNGVRVENSPETWVTDMNITGVATGIYVKGNCVTSDFWCNIFTSTFYGVNLDNANVTNQLNLTAPTPLATRNQWVSMAGSGNSKIAGSASPSIFWWYNGTGTNYDPTISPFLNTLTVNLTFTDNPADACIIQITPEEPGDPNGRMGIIDPGNGETPKKSIDITNTDNNSSNARMLDSLSPLEFYPVYLDSMGIEAAAIYNASITTETEAEAARKQVDEIHLRSWAQGISFFNASDSTYLCWLATENSDTFGTAVYSAQVMIGECYGETETARLFNKPVEAPIAVKESKGKIYPNPNDGVMQADFVFKENEKGTVEILSLSGKKLSSYNLKAGSNSFVIDESKLNAGVYLYRITINGTVTEIKKLVIVK